MNKITTIIIASLFGYLGGSFARWRAPAPLNVANQQVAVPGTELRTQRLVVVDEHDNVRAQLSTQDGAVSLLFTHADGKAAAGVLVSADGKPSLSVASQDGASNASLTVDKHVASLSLSAPAAEGSSEVQLISSRKMSGYACGHREVQTPSLTLSCTDQEPGLLLYDSKERARAALFVDKNRPQLLTYDETGTQTAYLRR